MVANELKKTPEQYLYDTYGLINTEAVSMVRLASRYALTKRRDIEEERALMVLRYEEFARRSREALNLPAELKAYKEMALVSGLTKVEPENENDELLKLVSSNEEEREKKLLTEGEDE